MVVCEPLPGVHHVLRSTGSGSLLAAPPQEAEQAS
jgi:hypothetical protein